MAKLIIEDKRFVGLVAAIIAFVALAPYFSPQGFAVANMQDFTITNVELPPWIKAGLSFDVVVTFANLGDVSGTSVTYSYEVLTDYNRVYYNEGTTDLLKGETKLLVVPINDEFSSGTYTLKVKIDSTNTFTESDETNNIYELKFTVP